MVLLLYLYSGILLLAISFDVELIFKLLLFGYVLESQHAFFKL